MGENCQNSPDCTCTIEVSHGELPDLKIGEMTTITLFVENTGNMPMLVDLELVAPNLQIAGGSSRVQLGAGEKQDLIFMAKGLETGDYSINVLATSSQTGQQTLGEVAMQVSSGSIFSEMLAKIKNTDIYGAIWEPLEFVMSIGGIFGALFGVWKIFFSKAKKHYPYTQPMKNYYGNSYYRGYYHGQGGQFKGYYRQFR